MARIENKGFRQQLSPDELEQRALAMRALGWLLLAVDGIVAVFVFVGIRTGALLWLYWTAIEGAAGMGLVVAGLRLEQIASRDRGHMVEAHLHAAADPEERKVA
jgi:hypothetical protein